MMRHASTLRGITRRAALGTGALLALGGLATSATSSVSAGHEVAGHLVPRSVQAGAQGAPQFVPVKATTASSLLPAASCALDATVPTQRDCDLWAEAGTIQPTPSAPPIPIWTFVLGTATTPSGPVVLPGATLVAVQNETLHITLHNDLTGASAGAGGVSLEIPAINGPQDAAGAATGSSKTYNYKLSRPGTFVYEAGATAQGPRQVAMGLSGMLVVRPPAATPVPVGSAGTALGTDATAYNAEALVITQEIDPAFNNAPLSADLAKFRPEYFFVDGQSFGGGTPITINVSPGDRLLLRYANVGLLSHSLGLVGQRQTLVEQNSSGVTNTIENTVEFLPAGESATTITQIDPSLHQGDTIALVDHNRDLYNGASNPGLAGMMAMITVMGLPGGSAAGPAVQVSVTPSTYNAAVVTTVDSGGNPVVVPPPPIQVTAAFSGPVTNIEYFIDRIGADGTGHAVPLPLLSGCGSVSLNTITFCLSLTDIINNPERNPLNGDHVIWVNGCAGLGCMPPTAAGWGYPSGDSIQIDNSGPIVNGVELHRPRTNGTTAPNDVDATQDVVILATGAASLADWNVSDAQWCLDSGATCTGATTGSLTVNPQGSPCTDPTTVAGPPDSPTSLCGHIPAATLAGLGQGAYNVYVRVRQTDPANTNGSWGSFGLPTAQATLVIDRTGPVASGISVAPTPNNGFQASTGNIGFLDSLLVQATFDDTGAGQSSPIDLAEAFHTTVKATSTAYTATTATDNNPATRWTVNGWTGDIVVAGATSAPIQSNTANTLTVGAWTAGQPTAGTAFVIQPTPANYGTGAEMTPAGGKWSQGATQGARAFLPLADIRVLPDGFVPIFVHGRDAAGNWGALQEVDLKLDRTAPTITSVSGGPATGTTQQGTQPVTVTATDPTTNGVTTGVTAAEVFGDVDPGAGNGAAVTGFASGTQFTISWGSPVPANTASVGTSKPTHAYVRVRDAAGNWSAAALIF